MPLPIIAAYRAAAAASGRSTLDLLAEATRLRLAPAHLGFREYLDYKLYQQGSLSDKMAYAGGWCQGAMRRVMTDERSLSLCEDKLASYLLFTSAGIPMPALRAVYGRQRLASVPALESAQALADYLCTPAHLPVYLKPVFGSYGRGNTLVTSCQGRTLVLGNGEQVAVSEFVESLEDPADLGWLLQEPLIAHPDLQALSGTSKVSGIRLLTMVHASGSSPFYATLKLNAGVRDSDNFEHGASGNLLAALDLQTGVVKRSISGTGARQVVNPPHPKTGKPTLGFQLPYWREAADLAVRAHRLLPLHTCTGWDLAITPTGPVMLEVNAFGDMDVIQHSHGEGFLGERFLTALREAGQLGLLDRERMQMRKIYLLERAGWLRHYWLKRHGVQALGFRRSA